jgi:hypothetical protein
VVPDADRDRQLVRRRSGEEHDNMTRHDEPLPADTFARRRKHLMSETTDQRRRLTRRTKALIGGLLAAAAVGGGTVAVAGTPGVFRRDDGVVEVDGQHLTPLYYGQAIPLYRVQELNKQHKAMVSVQNIEAGCHGVVLYFDTQAEADAYGQDYSTRLKAMRAKAKADGTLAARLAGDPCADWKAPLPTFTKPVG